MSTNASDAAGRPRRGRRPGTSDTRQVILEAARARFARDGYAAATIRKIAADAGVDTALVMQFFRSKDELFGAVMSLSPDALSRIAGAFGAPERSLGESVARAHLGVWEGDPQDSEPLLAMLRGAIVHEQANTQLREFIEARLTESAGPNPHDDDAALRVGLASAMLIGIVVARRIVQVPRIVDEDLESIVAAVAPALQEVLSPRDRPRTTADPEQEE